MEIFSREAESVDVGQRLRRLRDERGISMRALAKLSGLSANALSMIERGVTSPSVGTLSKVANALQVPITAFFRTESTREKVVFRKASERSRVGLTRGVLEGLGGEAFVGRVEAFLLTLESGGNSGAGTMVHSGHELVFMLRGKLQYEVEGVWYDLESGDSLLFSSHMKHGWRNPGNTVANAIIVISAFDEGERPSEYHLTASAANVEETQA